jgi:hypothetical protein
MMTMCNNLCSRTAEKRLFWLITMLAMYALQPFSAFAGSGILCDIQHDPCIMKTNDLTITFDILPKPVRTLSELRFMVTVKKHDTPVTDATVALDLSMPGMYMGRNRPELKHSGQGIYQGTGIITRCTSGKKNWQAQVTVGRGYSETVAVYQFEVQ